MYFSVCTQVSVLLGNKNTSHSASIVLLIHIILRLEGRGGNDEHGIVYIRVLIADAVYARDILPSSRKALVVSVRRYRNRMLLRSPNFRLARGTVVSLAGNDGTVRSNPKERSHQGARPPEVPRRNENPRARARGLARSSDSNVRASAATLCARRDKHTVPLSSRRATFYRASFSCARPKDFNHNGGARLHKFVAATCGEERSRTVHAASSRSRRARERVGRL